MSPNFVVLYDISTSPTIYLLIAAYDCVSANILPETTKQIRKIHFHLKL